MKKNLTIAAVVVAVIFALSIVKDQIIKGVITVAAEQVTGAPTNLGGFSLGVLKQAVRIKNFKMYNPQGFPKDVLVSIPEISVDYDLPALLKGKLHIPKIVVNLEEMGVTKNKEGKLNVDSLKVVQKEEKSSGAKKEKPAEMMPMQIDELVLSIGNVVFKDYSAGEQPTVQTYNVNIKDKVYKDISSPQQLVTLIMVEAMKPTAIKGAAIYGVASVLGVAFLPAGIAATFAGNDTQEGVYNVAIDRVFSVALETAKQMGKVSQENKAQGIIKAEVNGASTTIKVMKADKGTKVSISARKYLIPQPQVAGGVLYQISEKLK